MLRLMTFGIVTIRKIRKSRFGKYFKSSAKLRQIFLHYKNFNTILAFLSVLLSKWTIFYFIITGIYNGSRE